MQRGRREFHNLLALCCQIFKRLSVIDYSFRYCILQRHCFSKFFRHSLP